MKKLQKKWYLVIGIVILIIIVLIGGYGQEYVRKENECSSLKGDLRTEFNELSRSCLVDEDCTKFSFLTECLTVCGHCISKDADVSPLEDIKNKLPGVCSKISFCAPKCAVSICKCLNNTCKITQYYIACGCGCCVGEEPQDKCLYGSKGDDMRKIYEEDKKLAQSPECATMGCSLPIRYIYCD